MANRAAACTVLGLVVMLTGLVPRPSAGQSPAPRASAELVARGRYLATIMDCTGCHTGGALMGRPDPDRHLAGSEIGFEIPTVGVFYPKNLTPDPDTGLGRWSDPEIDRAIRRGQSRDGRPLMPVMPWPSYSILTDDDARALVAYLRSLKPVRFAVPPDTKTAAAATAGFLRVVLP
jgi:mono/diheme cytochrome c family protein